MSPLKGLLIVLVGSVASVIGTDELIELSDTIASEFEAEQIQELDEALYEGFVQGAALNFDYVSFGKQDNDVNDEKNEEKKEEVHEKNLERAELVADYLTRHRPLESTEVEESESDIYSLFNILIHYMTTRGQKWSLVEPKTVGLTDGGENHMVFISEASNAEDRQIPKNMILSVGGIAKAIPQKRGKTPILLTCLETFIVSKLSFNLMSKILESNAPIDIRLKYIERWIHLAKNHYVLYLPYITITAQRCYDLLNDGDHVKEEFKKTPYKILYDNCKTMLKKRDEEPDLQTFVMLDAELHSDLIEKCIEQKHIIPSLLEEKEGHLRRIHNVLDKEMSWEVFSNAMNMILSDLERNILREDHYLLKPSTWGCKLSKRGAADAEKSLIQAFAKSHAKLNLKVRSTIIKLSKELSNASEDKGSSIAKSLVHFVEQEFNAAKEEAESDKELSQCMREAKSEFKREAAKYGDEVTMSSYSTGIVLDMRKYRNEGWMPCMSARILDTIKKTCNEKKNFCKVLLEVLRDQISRLDPDSTSALLMENFHNVICVALLGNGDLTPEDLRSYLLKVTRSELKEVNALSGNAENKRQEEAKEKASQDTETKASESKEQEAEEGESKEGESKESESKEQEAEEGESKASESKEQEAEEGESKEGESKEGESKESESKEQEAEEGESKESESKEQEAEEGGESGNLKSETREVDIKEA
ncbi:hypothetical protein BgAZ_102830 [Babesia gibsoni]|uniref:Uncharacterized protein n=1 Tax=Babesia gibsoni TaxID=33632 RepID=A0AAD8PFH3_BABGI|nr:hypothetical protein BgAZ_102830 [Babesia gibsoni]